MSQHAQETVVVPRDPTPEMIEAAHRATPVTFLMDCDPTNIWWAMTRAAPVSPDSDLLKEAVGLLRPFAAMAEVGDQRPKDDAVYVVHRGRHITFGDLRKARAFLSKVEERGHD